MINSLPQNLNYLMRTTDALMNTMHRKPEDKMIDLEKRIDAVTSCDAGKLIWDVVSDPQEELIKIIQMALDNKEAKDIGEYVILTANRWVREKEGLE